MEKCWDSDPTKRPTVTELEDKISEWITCINEYHRINRNGNHKFMVSGIDKKLKNDMLDFITADNVLVQEEANVPILQSHSQACYTSRKLTEFSNCSDCKI
ncbi:kinase-like domain-containing protein [Rhizophagus clarus]|uniref:Kinase-like domain-containing protein n=1 Tax=Rhizophagus clarus TaxID=94130 RepID=A0A8H3KNI0_9GLOM|nr:kinase-like domain-containing protein [Rhizophagus clarus]